jgi:lysozyme
MSWYSSLFATKSAAQTVKQASKAAAPYLGAAVVFVGGFEGLRLTAYKDPVGIPTACWGETLGVKMGQTYTRAECDAKFMARLQEFNQKAVVACTPGDMPDERRVAFVSLSYNIGVGAYCKSTLAKRWKTGDVRGSCSEILKWDKAGRLRLAGLTRRRQAEHALCIKGL